MALEMSFDILEETIRCDECDRLLIHIVCNRCGEDGFICPHCDAFNDPEEGKQ